MTVLASHGVTDKLAELSGKWVLYLCNSACDFHELRRAVPFIDSETAIRLLVSSLWIVYDDEASAFEAFGQIIGDDGPTPNNPYNGPARVYAYLAGPNGGITENT